MAQESQKGSIGITLVSNWMVPFSSAKRHKNAAQRALDFMLGWYFFFKKMLLFISSFLLQYKVLKKKKFNVKEFL